MNPPADNANTATAATTPAPQAGPLSPRLVLGWGAFLACSWTWCIGMFLPALLVRDFGWWGYWAFFIPNVLGAAAMGWILRPGLSQRILAHHARAVRAFSFITRAFQAFFLAWLCFAVAPHGQPELGLTVLAFAVGLLVLIRPYSASDGRIALTSIAVWVISVLCGIFLLNLSFSGKLTAGPNTVQAVLTAPQTLYLAPVCIFGFLLCPYLDASFHHAAQRAQAAHPAGARAAFTVGFGVLFAAMIGLTAVYLPFFNQPANVHQPRLAITAIPLALLVHIALQIGFTIAAHKAAPTPDGTVADRRGVTPELAGIALALLAVSAPNLPLGGGEFIYRGFMACYGLFFPAYVWIVMTPLGRTAQRRPLLVWALACTIALPFYWQGFIGMYTFWLLPGVAILLAAKLLALPRRAAA